MRFRKSDMSLYEIRYEKYPLDWNSGFLLLFASRGLIIVTSNIDHSKDIMNYRDRGSCRLRVASIEKIR